MDAEQDIEHHRVVRGRRRSLPNRFLACLESEHQLASRFAFTALACDELRIRSNSAILAVATVSVFHNVSQVYIYLYEVHRSQWRPIQIDADRLHSADIRFLQAITDVVAQEKHILTEAPEHALGILLV